jgi:hypothetical protein
VRRLLFAIGSVHEQAAVVILTNGFNGMSIVPDLVARILPGHHPCFDWLGYQRHSSIVSRGCGFHRRDVRFAQ